MADTTTFFYVVAAAIEGFAGRTNPEQLTLREDMYQVLERAFDDAGLEWGTVGTQDRGDGVILLVPATGAGVTLAGTFVWALEQGLAERAKQYSPRHQMRLLVALAQGLCHRDARGWLGEPMEVASRLIGSPGVRERLAGPDAAVLAFAVSDEFHGAVIRHGYRQIDTGAFRPLPDPATRAWVRRPDRPAGIDEVTPATTDPDPSVRLAAEVSARLPGDTAALRLAEAIDDLAAPLAELADTLPAMFTPSVAPRDVLAWMRRTLGISATPALTEEQSRRILPGIIGCYLSQGTAAGLEELLRLRYGVRAHVLDPGGTTWSTSPAPAWDGANDGVVVVCLDTDEPLPGLDEVIRAALPVQLGYRVTRRSPA